VFDIFQHKYCINGIKSRHIKPYPNKSNKITINELTNKLIDIINYDITDFIFKYN